MPDSLDQIRGDHTVKVEKEQEEDRKAAEELEKQAAQDSFDVLMAGAGEQEEQDPELSRKKAGMRAPGLRLGSPDRKAEVATPAMRSKQGKTQPQAKKPVAPPPPCRTGAGSSGSSFRAPAVAAVADVAVAETASASNSKAGKSGKFDMLDSEMESVAKAHLEGNPGASVKCLISLDMKTYLRVDESSKQTLAARLRGVGRSALLENACQLH